MFEKSVIEQQITDDEKSWWKWDSADSPYAAYGYDDFFGKADELLDKRADGLSDDELYVGEWEARIDCMEEAMKRLDASGLFGSGEERECAVINVEQAPPDDDGVEYNRALRLINGARNKTGWERLDYSLNEELISYYLDTFENLIKRMTVDNIREDSLNHWLSESEGDDPVYCGFPRCEKHNTFLTCFGCQICNSQLSDYRAGKFKVDGGSNNAV